MTSPRRDGRERGPLEKPFSATRRSAARPSGDGGAGAPTGRRPMQVAGPLRRARLRAVIALLIVGAAALWWLLQS